MTRTSGRASRRGPAPTCSSRSSTSPPWSTSFAGSSAARKQGTHRMPTVVIADDSPTLRRIVTSVLTKEGYEVVVAEDGVEAVQAVFRTMPDACVFDVQMPRVSGYVASRVVKDDWQTSDIPIILLTSLDAASDRYWGKQVGADRYLTKDFEAPQLVEAVRETLAAAESARAGQPALRLDPVEVSSDDVLSRVC